MSGIRTKYEKVRITSNDIVDIMENLTNTLLTERVYTNTLIDLTNVSKRNSVKLDTCSLEDVSMSHERIKDFVYTFVLDESTRLIIFVNHKSPRYDKLILRFSHDNNYIFNVRYSHPISLNKQTGRKRSQIVSQQFSDIFHNKDKIVRYINKIILFPHVDIVDESIVSIQNYRGLQEASKVVNLPLKIANILKYEDQIENIDNVDLEEQYKFVDFLRNAINPIIKKYEVGDFKIIPSSYENWPHRIQFLGLTIAAFTDTNPHPAYFKYFRHRGISFMLNCIDRGDFEKRILEKSLKHDVGLETV